MYLRGFAQFETSLPSLPSGFDSGYGDGANYGYEVPYDATWGDVPDYGTGSEPVPGSVWSETPPPQYPSPSSTTGPTSTFDWTGLVTTAIKTYGQIETAKTQAETQQKVAPYQYRYPQPVAPGTAFPSSPFSPFAPTTGVPGAPLGIPLTYWLVGGAAVAAAFMLKG